MSSRTSVMLGRIVLAERYGVTPEFTTRPPILEDMLADADAALVIGDPALRLDPSALSYEVLDLGEEWWTMTGLPMVFAVWAGRRSLITAENGRIFADSCEYGLNRIEEIISSPAARHGFDPEIAREYLTRYIRFRLRSGELAGLRNLSPVGSRVRSRDGELSIASA